MNDLTQIQLQKSPTGISGFDELSNGGLPKGRPTLVCGSAGCGKTLFAMEFIVRGATMFDEPGVFIAFEENEQELAENVAALGWDISTLVKEKKIFVDYVYFEKSEIEETGAYSLDGLFIRIENALRIVNAKRIVLDTIEAIFSGFTDETILRAELRRLFRWLKQKGLTAIITGEKGKETFTRHGLEEYVSDCVVFLDHRMSDQIAIRRLRIVKYRGTVHGTNEYPFLIDERGFSVLPITSLGLNYEVSTERISTGIHRLDTMLDGKGFYRSSSILVSGTAGTGKSSMAACFVNAACSRNERSLYFSFEEPQQQIVRNMASIGINLQPWIEKGLLSISSMRITSLGLEMHLSMMLKLIQNFRPQVIVVDPISNLSAIGENMEAKEVVMRLVDFLKTNSITSMFTDLAHPGNALERTETAISSLMDTWFFLRDIELNGERNRGLYVLKSRGMNHSNQIREFLITADGLDLIDVYVGPSGVMTGTARVAMEARDRAELQERSQRIERLRRDLERKKRSLDAQIAGLKDAFATETEDLEQSLAETESQLNVMLEERNHLGKMRGKDN